MRYQDEKRPKILGKSSGAIFEKQSKHGEIQKKLTFGSIIASVTRKAVSLQLNGMLMMWKIQQAMEDDASRTARIHPDVHGKISSPFSEISGTKPARSLI